MTQLHLKKRCKVLFTLFYEHSRYAVIVSAAVATRSRADFSNMEDRRRKSGQTTRPPEIIIDIKSEEIRVHTSLSTALVYNM